MSAQIEYDERRTTWTRTCGCGASVSVTFTKLSSVKPPPFDGWAYDQHGFVLCPECSK